MALRKVPQLSRKQVAKESELEPRAVQQAVDEITEAVNIISAVAIGKGRLVTISDLVVTGGSSSVVFRHGLGREFQGCFVVNASGGTTGALEFDDNNKRKNTTVAFTHTGTATSLTVWVF